MSRTKMKPPLLLLPLLLLLLLLVGYVSCVPREWRGGEGGKNEDAGVEASDVSLIIRPLYEPNKWSQEGRDSEGPGSRSRGRQIYKRQSNTANVYGSDESYSYPIDDGDDDSEGEDYVIDPNNFHRPPPQSLDKKDYERKKQGRSPTKNEKSRKNKKSARRLKQKLNESVKRRSRRDVGSPNALKEGGEKIKKGWKKLKEKVSNLRRNRGGGGGGGEESERLITDSRNSMKEKAREVLRKGKEKLVDLKKKFKNRKGDKKYIDDPTLENDMYEPIDVDIREEDWTPNPIYVEPSQKKTQVKRVWNKLKQKIAGLKKNETYEPIDTDIREEDWIPNPAYVEPSQKNTQAKGVWNNVKQKVAGLKKKFKNRKRDKKYIDDPTLGNETYEPIKVNISDEDWIENPIYVPPPRPINRTINPLQNTGQKKFKNRKRDKKYIDDPTLGKKKYKPIKVNISDEDWIENPIYVPPGRPVNRPLNPAYAPPGPPLNWIHNPIYVPPPRPVNRTINPLQNTGQKKFKNRKRDKKYIDDPTLGKRMYEPIKVNIRDEDWIENPAYVPPGRPINRPLNPAYAPPGPPLNWIPNPIYVPPPRPVNRPLNPAYVPPPRPVNQNINPLQNMGRKKRSETGLERNEEEKRGLGKKIKALLKKMKKKKKNKKNKKRKNSKEIEEDENEERFDTGRYNGYDSGYDGDVEDNDDDDEDDYDQMRRERYKRGDVEVMERVLRSMAVFTSRLLDDEDGKETRITTTLDTKKNKNKKMMNDQMNAQPMQENEEEREGEYEEGGTGKMYENEDKEYESESLESEEYASEGEENDNEDNDNSNSSESEEGENESLESEENSGEENNNSSEI